MIDMEDSSRPSVLGKQEKRHRYLELSESIY